MKDPNDPVMSLGLVRIARLPCTGLEAQAWRQEEMPLTRGWQKR